VEVKSPAPHAILVVDDAPTNLVAYRAALEALGREIVTVTSGCEAIRLLGDRQFALLLIDVRMPVLDGFATVELLRHQLHRLTPVIFITGDSDDAAMRRAYEFGAVDYLVKPVPPEILRGKVRNLLALYEQGIELEKRAALLREKDTNIGILAHDLRNPLAAIMTSADHLAHLSDASDKAHRIGARIGRSARRMTVMIRDILDYTRGRLGGGIPLNRQPTDLAVLSQSVVDEIRAGYPTVRIEIETAGKLTGEWDPARIEQALSNLIANAVQHGGEDVKLIASGEDRDQVVVTVQNGGRPIPREHIPSLFDAFKKGEASPEGLGLGLFIVREIVQAHDGSVAVSSSEEGTVFSFRLPRGSTGTAAASASL
jgi:two-component system sensor histidine kinase/response regulator